MEDVAVESREKIYGNYIYEIKTSSRSKSTLQILRKDRISASRYLTRRLTAP